MPRSRDTELGSAAEFVDSPYSRVIDLYLASAAAFASAGTELVARPLHEHYAAGTYRQNTRPTIGRNRTKMSSFDLGHQTMPVAVGVVPPLHELSRGNEVSANSR